MIIFRISPTEVQLGTTIYIFVDPDLANEFECCVPALGIDYCEVTYEPSSIKTASLDSPDGSLRMPHAGSAGSS